MYNEVMFGMRVNANQTQVGREETICALKDDCFITFLYPSYK